jgi:hypothetical protein
MKMIEAVSAPGKSCGTCSLCCKLFEVSWLDKPKPAGSWCHHCSPGKGCAIWQDRPKGCADYHCVWRVDPALASEWRPDHAHFILSHPHTESPLSVVVDPRYPGAYRREPYWSALLKTARGILLTKGSTLLILSGAQRALLFPDGFEQTVPSGFPLHEVRIIRQDGAGGALWRAEFPEC